MVLIRQSVFITETVFSSFFGAPSRKSYLFNEEDWQLSKETIKIWTDFFRQEQKSTIDQYYSSN